MINRDGTVHTNEFIATVAFAIIGGVLLAWVVLNSKKPGLIGGTLFCIVFGIAACVWK